MKFLNSSFVSIKVGLLALILTSTVSTLVKAEDKVFPLSSALTDSALWDQPSFLNLWQPTKSPAKITHKTWPGAPLIFDLRPHLLSGHFIGERLDSITILFLDSGTYFGYVSRDQVAATKKSKRANFQALYSATEEQVLAGLKKLSGSKAQSLRLGSTPLLQQTVQLFNTGKLTARYFAVPDQVIKVTFYRDDKKAQSLWMEPSIAKMKRRDRIQLLSKNMHEADNGDRLLDNIPLFPQGDRAYCGVSALAMSMQYLGLNIDTEDYAAAAGIRFGSTKGSIIKEVYEAAGREANMRLSRSTKFDFRRVKAALDDGLPVIVWRRWAKERDYVHSTFAARFAKQPTAVLPKADMNDRATWPGKKAYSHASVITGYNDKRGEVIFTESWGEAARNRRMRYEEMESTVYYTFFPKL